MSRSSQVEARVHVDMQGVDTDPAHSLHIHTDTDPTFKSVTSGTLRAPLRRELLPRLHPPGPWG